MNLRNVVLYCLAIVGLVGVIWWWGGKTQANSPLPGVSDNELIPSSLSASETLYDFGTISMGQGKVSYRFKVSNPSSQAVTVESLTTSCMCTAAFIVKADGSKRGPFGMPGHGVVPKANEIIGAGESREIEVIYDPAAHGPAGVGKIDRFVFLQETGGGVLELEIKANVTP